MHHMHLSGPHGPWHPVQILREHVMVRVGGGWDTLEHYLDKHDPCRCTSLCESPRPQIPWFCPMTGGGVGVSVLSLAASGAICRSRRPHCHGPSVLCWGMSGFGDFLWLWWPLEVTADFWMEPDPKSSFAGTAGLHQHPWGAGW